MIQLIVSDMDGTLLDDKKQLPPKFLQLMEQLYCRDITFAVASGRSRIALITLFGDAAKDMIFICDNGACVMLPHRDPILKPLCQSAVTKTLNLCKDLSHTTPVLCGYHHIYFPANAPEDVRTEICRFYQNFRVLPYEEMYQVTEPILKIALCNKHTLESRTCPAMFAIFGDSYEQLVSGDC